MEEPQAAYLEQIGFRPGMVKKYYALQGPFIVWITGWNAYFI